MNEAIKDVCTALKEEAEAVISYTDKIAASPVNEATSGTKQTFEEIRLDEVEHIQKLCLELTKIITSSFDDSEKGNEEAADEPGGDGNE